MNQSSLSRALLAAGVLAFAGFAQAGPMMTGSGETNMTPTTRSGSAASSSTNAVAQTPAGTGSGETSMTATTQTMGAAAGSYRGRSDSGHQGSLTGSGETSMTATTHSTGVTSPTVR